MRTLVSHIMRAKYHIEKFIKHVGAVALARARRRAARGAVRVCASACWVGVGPTAHLGAVFRPPCMRSRLRCMIRCVRVGVHLVGVCRTAVVYGRTPVKTNVGEVAPRFCYY